MTARIMVFAKIKAGTGAEFEAAFREVSAKVKGTPGHIEDELIRRDDDSDSYVLLSKWESKEKFLEWEDAPIHRGTTTPMRPYWEEMNERVIFEVRVKLDEDG